MKRWLILIITLLTVPALAQSLSPKEIVSSFFTDYTQAMQSTPGQWVQTLMENQINHVESPLVDGMLRLAEGDPSKGEPFLDFDPFSNSQMGMETFTVGEPVMKQGLAYVPVSMRLAREPGPEKVRLHMILRDQGAGWKIANVAYPAENGVKAWDLKKYLGETLQQ
jgi:hypothetical protein